MPIRYRGLMVLAAVLFGQLLLMAYQLRRKQDIPLVRGSVVYVVSPIQRSFSAVAHAIRGVWDGYIYLWSTRRVNQTLQNKLDSMSIENQRLREQAEEGKRLQVLFDLRQQVPLPTVAAQVLSTSSNDTARIVLIDKGADAGLKPDQPVMVPDGVVGKVLHVFPTTAQVLLVTDPYSGVACLLEDSRVHGILKGQNKALATLWYVPNGEDVKPGQRILTSGEDQIYPKGLPVGVVTEVKPGPEFMQIAVRPLAPLNRLEDVLIILQSGGDVGSSPIASRGSPASGAVPSSSAPAPSGPSQAGQLATPSPSGTAAVAATSTGSSSSGQARAPLASTSGPLAPASTQSGAPTAPAPKAIVSTGGGSGATQPTSALPSSTTPAAVPKPPTTPAAKPPAQPPIQMPTQPSAVVPQTPSQPSSPAAAAQPRPAPQAPIQKPPDPPTGSTQTPTGL